MSLIIPNPALSLHVQLQRIDNLACRTGQMYVAFVHVLDVDSVAASFKSGHALRISVPLFSLVFSLPIRDVGKTNEQSTI